jgi:hypothetical protein
MRFQATGNPFHAMECEPRKDLYTVLTRIPYRRYSPTR